MQEGLKAVAIIPARGGSKRIPKKNLRLLCGKPLVSWTIEHALNSSLVNRTVVSTDDEEIKVVSRACGAEVIERPKDLAQDDSPSEGALIHTLDFLERTEQYTPDLVVFLQCTSPLRRKDDIDKAIRKLKNSGADSLMSVTAEQDTFWIQTDVLSPVTFEMEKFSRLTKNLKILLRENGSFYVIKPHILRERRSRLGGKIETYQMPREYTLEIDDEFDLWLAEKIMQEWQKKNPPNT